MYEWEKILTLMQNKRQIERAFVCDKLLLSVVVVVAFLY